MAITAIILFTCFVGWLTYNFRKTKPVLSPSFTLIYRTILSGKVNFYNQLSGDDKTTFEKRMLHFLSRVKITGVNCMVEDEDRVLVAASAIIPIFGFLNWEYNNLNEVLLYPEPFNKDFNMAESEDKSILGMVGSGAMQYVMILSQPSLREGFSNKAETGNTGIHEFVHLLDKTDGAVDGIPENLMDKQYVVPWIKRMHEGINQIIQNQSDINPYGSVNEAEFFAVVAEYFFQQPNELQSKHPELYEMLQQIFRQNPAR